MLTRLKGKCTKRVSRTASGKPETLLSAHIIPDGSRRPTLCRLEHQLTVARGELNLEASVNVADGSGHKEHDHESSDGIAASMVGVEVCVNGVEDAEHWKAPADALYDEVVAVLEELVDDHAEQEAGEKVGTRKGKPRGR